MNVPTRLEMNDRFSEIKDKESYYFQFVQIDKRPCAIINFIISGVAFMNGVYFINIITEMIIFMLVNANISFRIQQMECGMKTKAIKKGIQRCLFDFFFFKIVIIVVLL